MAQKTIPMASSIRRMPPLHDKKKLSVKSKSKHKKSKKQPVTKLKFTNKDLQFEDEETESSNKSPHSLVSDSASSSNSWRASTRSVATTKTKRRTRKELKGNTGERILRIKIEKFQKTKRDQPNMHTQIASDDSSQCLKRSKKLLEICIMSRNVLIKIPSNPTEEYKRTATESICDFVDFLESYKNAKQTFKIIGVNNDEISTDLNHVAAFSAAKHVIYNNTIYEVFQWTKSGQKKANNTKPRQTYREYLEGFITQEKAYMKSLEFLVYNLYFPMLNSHDKKLEKCKAQIDIVFGPVTKVYFCVKNLIKVLQNKLNCDVGTFYEDNLLFGNMDILKIYEKVYHQKMLILRAWDELYYQNPKFFDAY
eukprot:TRINITY_DN2521_c0_g1_i4.p1 TRINITY_DN2521_c0_g1~~TRINITY_DN2521_c0_g1_i4.p1  ORF type:complete len:366 (-),score=41.20 TRINITY_DN2521_c0_g1_i4:252-1349(-)